METQKQTEQPQFDAQYFEDISADHSRVLAEARGVLAARFYTYTEPRAWDLLVEAQQTCHAHNTPDVVTAQLLDPSTGGWLSELIPYERPDPQTGTTREKDADFAWHILHAHSIAASAALQAGVPSFAIEVPAWSGRVTLPGIGQAKLCSADAHDDTRQTALLTASPESVVIEGCGNRLELSRITNNDMSEWSTIERVTIDGVEPGTTWSVLLDDINPYRLTSSAIAPAADIHQLGHPAHQYDAEAWHDITKASMELLVQDHPGLARDISREVRAVVPLSFKPQAIRLRPYSASSSSTAGAIELDYQHYPDVAAASLVHEGAHNKYYGLVLKHPFVRTDQANHPYLNSPWRSDVRPASGHLLGIDAFSSVAEFWRQRLSVDVQKRPYEAQLASYEVSFLRLQIELAISQIDGDKQVLTDEGQAFIDSILKPRITQIDNENIPILTTQAAKDAVEYHIAMWRAHHYQPPQSLVDTVVDAWNRGDECPQFTNEADKLVPGKGYYFDLWSTFHRLCIAEPEIFADIASRPQEIAEHVQGAQPRDILSFVGKAEEAQHDFCSELTATRHIDPRTIVGLGFTLVGMADIRPAALLRGEPHVYRKVFQTLIDNEVERPDPVQLARWMSGGYGTPRQRLGTEKVVDLSIAKHLRQTDIAADLAYSNYQAK